MRMRTLVVSALLATVGVLTIASPTAGAVSASPVLLDRAPTAAEWDTGQVACMLQVIGQDRDGRFRTDPMSCWLVAEGDRTAPWSRGGKDASASRFTTVGYHFAYANYGGSYIAVAGTVCNGGWLDLDGNWINRISSTSSNCWVVHWDGYGLTGASEALQYGNLSSLDDRANSLQYF